MFEHGSISIETFLCNCLEVSGGFKNIWWRNNTSFNWRKDICDMFLIKRLRLAEDVIGLGKVVNWFYEIDS